MIDTDDLIARGRHYYRKRLRETTFSNTDNASVCIASAYLAGYDEASRRDTGPTIERDAALIAFSHTSKPWSLLAEPERQRWLTEALAGRIMTGATYVG